MREREAVNSHYLESCPIPRCRMQTASARQLSLFPILFNDLFPYFINMGVLYARIATYQKRASDSMGLVIDCCSHHVGTEN